MRAGRLSTRSVVGLSACLGVAAALTVAASCATSSPSTSTTTGPTAVFSPKILGTQALLDSIEVFSLTVYAANAVDGGLTCNPATGVVAGVTLLTPPLVPATRGAKGGAACPGDERACFLGINVPDSPTVPRIFAITGYSNDPPTNVIAYGCGTATLSDAAMDSLMIDMQPLAGPPPCGPGNTTTQVTQTCAPPSTSDAATVPQCSSTCQTVEQLLSTGSGAVDGGSGTTTGNGSQKNNPSFVWPVGGNFLGFFGDTASGATSQIAVRLLSPQLAGSTLLGTIAETESFFLPNTPGGPFPPSPEPHAQQQPSAADINGVTYVAFADDSATDGGSTYAINLRSLDANVNAQQAKACPVSTAVSGASFSNPSLAAGGSSSELLYVAWQDNQGNVYGRVYTPNASGACGTLGTQEVLSSTSAGESSSVTVAGIPSGWVVAWRSGSDIYLRAIASGGNLGGPAKVEPSGHTASAPSIASIPSGNIAGQNVGGFAVVWADQAPGSQLTTIYAQRYYGVGAKELAGTSIEAPTQISQSQNGGEGSPFMVGCPTETGSYVVAWVDEGSSGQVRARFLSGTAGRLSVQGDAGVGLSAYLPNTIDGTGNEFQVSSSGSRSRTLPTVAIGGGTAAPYVAFGWVDSTSGIVARRFPAP